MAYKHAVDAVHNASNYYSDEVRLCWKMFVILKRCTEENDEVKSLERLIFPRGGKIAVQEIPLPLISNISHLPNSKDIVRPKET